MKKLFLIIILISLAGCGSNRSALATYNQSARIDPDLIERYEVAQSPTEEYVNRIAKKVMLVRERPNSNYTFSVTQDNEPSLIIDNETHTIAISRGALERLHDEAELAATLTLSMARLDNLTNADKETAITLSRAGYDPQAMLDLQEEYFHAANSTQAHWLHTLYPVPPTASKIMANQTMIESMPKGLLRGSEDYTKYINE